MVHALGLDHVSDVEEPCRGADVVVACDSEDMSASRRDGLDAYLRRRCRMTTAWKSQRMGPSSRHCLHESRTGLSAEAVDV